MQRTTRGMICFACVAFSAGPRALAQCEPAEGHKLIADDASQNQWLGRATALSNDLALVGAIGDVTNGPYSGAAYLFDPATGEQLAKLLPDDGGDYAHFGSSIDLSDRPGEEYVLVGAPGIDDRGAAYVFGRTGDVWTQRGKLVPSDPILFGDFGYSVSADGAVLVVGSLGATGRTSESGAAYVFRHDGVGWSQAQKIIASDGEVSDWFGGSVAIEDDWMIVGAEGDGDNGYRSGAAYIFRFNGQSWEEHQKLHAADGGEGDHFGTSVDLSGGLAVIGAPHPSDPPKAGAVYTFRQSEGSWDFEQQIAASDSEPSSRFGWSVACRGETMLIGADGMDGLEDNVGAVYLFHHDGDGWQETAKITASDAQAYDNFGWSVAMSDTGFVAGAPGEDEGASLAGAAYLFDLHCGCAADINGDGAVNTQDFIAFLNAWAGGDPVADWNGDGTINTQDFIAYLNDWAAGC